MKCVPCTQRTVQEQLKDYSKEPKALTQPPSYSNLSISGMTLNMPDPWKSHSATHRTKGSSTPVPNATQWSAGDFHAVAVQCMYCTSQTVKLQLRCLWGTNIYLYIRLKKQHIVFFFPFLYHEDRKNVPRNVYGYVEEPSKLKANKKYDWLKLVDAYQTVEMKKKKYFFLCKARWTLCYIDIMIK